MSSDATKPGAAGIGCEDEWLALEVSDYVSGRLDPLAARDIERRARYDGRLAATILEAKAVLRRVERRLTRRPAAHSSARTNAPFTGDAVPVAGPFTVRPEVVRGFA